MNSVEVNNRAEWRDWLAANHDRETEVWLIYYKKEAGISSIKYNESVEEALCFGWIDSIIKKIDDTKYVRKFTPRKDDSKWSPSNIERVERLMNQGLMTEYGLEKIEAAKRAGIWDKPNQRPELQLEMSAEFVAALDGNRRAKKMFENLAPTYQKQYLGWIEVAKRPETKEKRIKESVRLLAEGKKLGLK